jgi:macrolide-specific efflux system membrane fusion protein
MAQDFSWNQLLTGRRRIVGLAVIAALVLFASYWLFWRSSPATDRYVIAEVKRGDIEDTVTAVGNLQPRDYVDVGAQVSGQLKTIHVAIGDTVRKGDLLAEIDATVQAAKVGASQAQLLNLRAQLADREAQAVLAEAQFGRQQQLQTDDATSVDAVQSAKASLASTQAQIKAIKAQIKQTEASLAGDEATLGYSRIFAPMAGTVVSLAAKQGQTLNANQVAPIILRIADLSTMTVWTQVSEADVARLRVGMEAYFTTLGSAQRWYGKLRQLLPTPETVNNVVLYTALFDVANPEGRLMTQMSAQVFFVVSAARDVLTVPMGALHAAKDAAQGPKSQRPAERDSGATRSYFVTVLDRRDNPVEREVKVGVTNRVSAEVLAGLTEGERVVTGERSTDEKSSKSPTQGQGTQQQRMPMRGL